MSVSVKSEESQPIAEINMTPLIDIMLVLLIIFMITSSISLESGVNEVTSSANSGKTKTPAGSPIKVSLDRMGDLFVDGKKTDVANLKTVIQQALQEGRNSSVILEGDRQATLGRAVQIMKIAKEAGAAKFAIAAREDKE
jgi:biopolymer transport protein ExbD